MLPQQSLIKFSQRVRWAYIALYTHTHTYTLCFCVCCCFIEATSNEFSLILWFDMYGLWGNSPAQALKLLVYFSFLFFCCFIYFNYENFLRVAKAKARANKKKSMKSGCRSTIFQSSCRRRLPTNLSFIQGGSRRVAAASFSASSKQTFTAQLFLERSFVVNWWVLNCFDGPMNISFTFRFIHIFFAAFLTLLPKFMHNQQS